MHPYISGCTHDFGGRVIGVAHCEQVGSDSYSLQASIAEQAASIAELASTAATDVGMHGLLAIVNRVTILCYPLVSVHCGPVISSLLSRHPYILLISLETFFIYFIFKCTTKLI